MSLRAHGMRAWLLQRLTAVYIAVYLVSVLIWISSGTTISYQLWLNLFSHPLMLIATLLFYLSLFVHAWVGMRDIFVDYIKPSSVRFSMLILLASGLCVMGLWVLLIVIRLVK